MRDLNRRRFVQGTGAALAVGALAGCTGNGNGNGNGDDDEPDNGNDDADALLEFLEDANEFDGELADHTGEDEVEVAVGAGDRGLAYEPAGMQIDAGTTVVWEWTGEGGRHDVNSTDESDFDFESELTDEAGFTFEFTFDEAGDAMYVCEPHTAQGMLGGIRVE